MKGILYKDETMGADYELVDIPEEYADQAHKMREEMVEAISETDDQLLEKYLSGEEVTNDELKAALRRATIANQIQPVICGSAFKNKGVQPLLDAVVDYLPSPLDIPPIEGHRSQRQRAKWSATRTTRSPFSGLVFKIMTDPFVGQLVFFRVYSGHVESGGTVLSSKRNSTTSASAACSRCTPTSARRSRRSGRATSRRRSA